MARNSLLFVSLALLILSCTPLACGYEWEKTFGGSSYDFGVCLDQTTDGGYVMVGVMDFFDVEDSDIYLIKTDANGNELWSRTYGGDSHDEGWSVQQTADGGYIIAGYFTYVNEPTDADVYLIKTDSKGNELWSKTYGGNNRELGSSVQETADGAYIIVGWTSVGVDDLDLSHQDGRSGQ